MLISAEESYTQITNFLQGFIDNEVNLNTDASCSSTCSDYRQTKHYHCAAGTLCAEVSQAPTCNGVVRECEEIDDSEIDICQNVCLGKFDATVAVILYYNFNEYPVLFRLIVNRRRRIATSVM